MNAVASKHPPREFLEAFGLGKLGAVAATKVNTHLETCAECRRQVAELSSDSLLNHLRQANAPTNTPASSDTSTPPPPANQPAPTPPGPRSVPAELLNNAQYEILRELGAGGMGVVYLAKNKLMDRLEVLKVISTAMVHKSGAMDRFLREIRAAAALSHDNVVKAHSALQFGGLLAFAMEYVEGEDLAKVVKAQGQLPIANACFYARQAALGLQHAHEKNMVHRDIKPHNLILARDGKKHVVKILDFGLAKATSEKKLDRELTGEGRMLGTPDYMAPEQIENAAAADIRADIYSLGCTLYYLLTGATPFNADSLYGLLQAHQTQEARSVNLVRPEVPMELGAIVAKMMAKDPARRYQKPIEVAQALAPFLIKGRATGPSPPLALSIGEPAQAAPARPAAAPKLVEAIAPIPTAKLAPPSTPTVANPLSFPPTSEVEPLAQTTVKAKTPRRVKPSWLVGVAAAATLLGLLFLLGSIILRVESKDGTLIIKSDDPNAVVKVTPEGGATLTYGKERREIQLKPGKYGIELADAKSGLKLSATQFTLTADDKKTIEISWEKKADAPGKIAEALPPKELGLKKAADGFVPLFNGKDLTGWEGLIDKFWSVEDGAIVGSTPPDGTKFNTFLCSKKKYKDFELQFQVKLTGKGWAGNSGVQIRSRIHDMKKFAVTGPQCDMGAEHWGSLYGENLGVTMKAADPKLVEDVLKINDYNDYYIKCAGKHVTIKLNGKTTVDDDFAELPEEGIIAWQIHAGGPMEVTFRKIQFKNLSAAPAPGDSTASPDRTAAEYVLSNGGVVRVNGYERDIRIVAHLPREAFQLTYVHLNENRNVRDAGLANFKDCKNLTFLWLEGTQLTNAGLANFKNCKNLTNLFLGGTKVSDAGLVHFKDCKSLKGLGLNFANVSDTGLANFSGCKNLNNLSLGEARQVGNAGMTHFKDCKDLESIDLSCTYVTDEGLANFKGCNNVVLLRLRNMMVTDAGLAYFKDCKNLKLLQVQRTQVGDAGLAYFKICKNLQILEQKGSKVTKAGLDDFRKALPKCRIDAAPDQ